ncbi:MAG: signal peptidase I [Candidatus Hydrogenedentes bacterium]|nr:signal peptidase I [Candidatus Hydrogenedentota bacterium]
MSIIPTRDETQTQLPDSDAATKTEVKREVAEFVKLVVWFLVLFFFIRTWVVEGYEVQGPSMIPTLHDRERILVFKLPHELTQWSVFSGIAALNLKEGEIVVFQSSDDPGKRYVKRIIAKGPHRSGNTVDASGQDTAAPPDAVHVRVADGQVYVNNRRITEDYTNPDEAPSSETLREVTLAPGKYYVMGDNRYVSKDSRFFGAVDDSQVVGRAILRFWPLSKFGFL